MRDRLLLQDVAEAAHGVNQRPRQRRLQLAPDVADVDVRHVGERIVVAAPDVLGQLIARDDRFGAPDQVLQQPVFRGGQRQRLPLQRHPMIDGIDRERTVRQRAGGLAVPASPIERAQPGQQLLERERLDEIVVGAAIERAHPIAHRVARADAPGPGCRSPGARICAAHLEAVQPRQHQVEHDGIVVGVAGLVESRRAVLGEVHDVLVFAQALQQEATDLRIVFDEQQSHPVSAPQQSPQRRTRSAALCGISMSDAHRLLIQRISSVRSHRLVDSDADSVKRRFCRSHSLLAPARLAAQSAPASAAPRPCPSADGLARTSTGPPAPPAMVRMARAHRNRWSASTSPLPDFSDCAFATAEPDPDWHAVVHEGGPIRGLDRHMPAFGDALSARGDRAGGRSLRTFCRRPGVAARRSEPAARVLHREGLSRERDGLDDDVHRPRRALGRQRADLRAPPRGAETRSR